MTKILVDRLVLEQVMEALECVDLQSLVPDYGSGHYSVARLDGPNIKAAITALGAALAEPVQEPMYWEVRCTAHPKWMRVDERQFDEYVSHGWEGQKLYTALSTEKIGKNL